MATLIGLTGDVSVGAEAKEPVSFTDYGNTAQASNGLTGGWSAAKYYWPERDTSGDLVIRPGANSIAVFCKAAGKTWQDVKAERGLSQNNAKDVANQIRFNPEWGYGASDALALDMELAQVMVRAFYSEYFQSPWLLFKRGDVFPHFLAYGSDNGSFEYSGESAARPIFISSYGDTALAKPHFQGAGPRIVTGAANIIVSGVSHSLGMLVAGNKYMGIDNISTDGSLPLDGTHAGTTMQATDEEGFKHAFMSRLNLQDVSIRVPSNANGLWTFSTDRGSSMYLSKGIYVRLDKIFSLYSGWATDYTQGGDGSGGQPPDDRSHGGYAQHSLFGLTVSDMFIMKPNFNAFQFRQGAVTQDLLTVRPNSGFFYGAQIEDGQASYADGVAHIGAGWKQWAGNTNGPGSPATVAEGPVVNMPQLPVYRYLQANSGAGVFFTDPADLLETADGGKLTANLGQQERGVRFGVPTVATGLMGSWETSLEDNFVLANWGVQPDENVSVSVAAQIDALSLGGWLDQHQSTTGSTEADFEAWLRTEDAPWDHIQSINDYFMAPIPGWTAPARTVATTCIYRPVAEHLGPPKRTDIKRNWSTKDLPGTVAGDGASLAEYADDVEWNGLPTLTGPLTFGSGNLALYGGAISPSALSLAAGGNTVRIDGGARFEINGYGGSERLRVTAEEGDFLNTGTVTGQVDVTSRYASQCILADEGGSFTLDSGGQINVYGSTVLHAPTQIGFDGYTGGSASVTINGALNFKPGCWIELSNLTVGAKLAGIRGGVNDVYLSDSLMPNEGDIITGGTSGATGIVRKVLNARPYGSDVGYYLYVTDMVGTFAAGETLSADTLYLREIFAEGSGDFATVASSPGYAMGRLGEVASGRGPALGELPPGFSADGRGAAAPDVNSVLTLGAGASVTVDTTGLATGSYDLIDVDSLTDNGASLPPGVTVVGGKLVLIVV